MGVLDIGQAVNVGLEKVRPVLPVLYEQDDMFLGLLLTKGDVQKVGARLMRLPLQIKPGGKGRAVNFGGGDLGRGSGTQYDVAQVTPQGFAFAIEWQKIAEYATDADQKAITNLVSREIKNAMKQFRTFLDQIAQTAGNGVIGTISAINGQVLTLANPPGCTRLYETQDVQVYDTTITTNRGRFTTINVDPFGKTVGADPSTPLPAGTIVGDVLVYDGLTGAQPIGLFGIPYFQNNATSGIYLNLSRTVYPVQLKTPSVNLANASITPAAIMQAINFIRKALGTAQAGGGGKASKLIAYVNTEQFHQYRQLGITISTIIKEGGANQEVDDLELNFTGKATWFGAPEKVSIHADPTRVDFLDLAHWGRAEMKAIDLYSVDGKTKFPIYGASGGLSAAEISYFVTLLQIWNDSPRSGAYLYGCAIPPGY